MHISGLYQYPVKSFQGERSARLLLGVKGFPQDRIMMLVDADQHRFLSQRSLPVMAAFRMESFRVMDNILHFEVVGPEISKAFSMPLASCSGIDAEVWGKPVKALDLGDEVAGFLRFAFQEQAPSQAIPPLRLVLCEKEQGQRVDPKRIEEDVLTAFSDGFPYLVTSEASLQALRQALLEKEGNPLVGMQNFRPNLVLSGGDAWEEEQHKGIVLPSGYRLWLAKPCERCSITTLQPETGVSLHPKEPLVTLTKLSRGRGHRKPIFGMNAVLCDPEGNVISTEKSPQGVFAELGEAVTWWD